MHLNSEIQLMAYRRIFEYPTTTLEDHASIVYSVYLHVESSLKHLISTAHMPYLCVWLCGKLGYTYTLLLHHPESNPAAKAT